MKYSEYNKTLSLSKKIYKEVLGVPSTHKEWAESFNIIGKINRLIHKNKINNA